MQAPTLVLRDIHQPATPPWWPPAPGWWLLLAIVIVLVAFAVWWHRRRARRRQGWMRLFDDTVAQAHTAPERIAAMSELLRRAAMQADPAARTLEGEAWLEFLDAGESHRPFSRGPGAALLEGGFRRDGDVDQIAALQALARERFLGWMSR